MCSLSLPPELHPGHGERARAHPPPAGGAPGRSGRPAAAPPPAFKEAYARRAGVEGTLSQAVHRAGLRQARYVGLAKTHLQHLATAAALNMVRLGAWWAGTPLVTTRRSAFAALAA